MQHAAMPLLAHSPVRAMATRCAARWTCFQLPFPLDAEERASAMRVLFCLPRCGRSADRCAVDSLRCRRAFSGDALFAGHTDQAQRPGPAIPVGTPPASSVVIGYAPSFSGVRDLSKSHDTSTRHARSHEITAPNCWCELPFGRSAGSACEAASREPCVRKHHIGLGRTCIFESARAVRQRLGPRAPVLSPQ
jgi:hypothetical protein